MPETGQRETLKVLEMELSEDFRCLRMSVSGRETVRERPEHERGEGVDDFSWGRERREPASHN